MPISFFYALKSLQPPECVQYATATPHFIHSTLQAKIEAEPQIRIMKRPTGDANQLGKPAPQPGISLKAVSHRTSNALVLLPPISA